MEADERKVRDAHGEESGRDHDDPVGPGVAAGADLGSRFFELEALGVGELEASDQAEAHGEARGYEEEEEAGAVLGEAVGALAGEKQEGKKCRANEGADLVHGAYALEGDNVILIDTLEFETMDLEEFQASLDAVGLALAQHYPLLAKYMGS
ncbi:MAG: YbjN domain-containing protein [Candidatus Competibacteraceae bacterium]|nr:YbjN domain-containing protein [Candidatus Competibacteraceae bacterium]